MEIVNQLIIKESDPLICSWFNELRGGAQKGTIKINKDGVTAEIEDFLKANYKDGKATFSISSGDSLEFTFDSEGKLVLASDVAGLSGTYQLGKGLESMEFSRLGASLSLTDIGSGAAS